MKPQRRKNIVRLFRLEKKKVNKAPAPKTAEKRKAESWIEKESNWGDKLKKQEEFTLKELMRLYRRITETKEEIHYSKKPMQALVYISLSAIFGWFMLLLCGWLGLVASIFCGFFGGRAIGEMIEWIVGTFRRKREEEKEE